jgi:hypothetical protein
MKPEFTPERLLHALEETNGELHVLWEAIDAFRDELIYEIRNRLQTVLAEPQKSPETSESIAESISCTECDIDSPNSLAEALREGWTELRYEPSGSHWNFLGCCPSCTKNEPAEAVVKEWAAGPKPKGELF